MLQLNNESAAAILERNGLVDEARLFRSRTNPPFAVYQLSVDLTTAKLRTAPYEISVPFRTIYVSDATDGNANVNVVVDSNDSVQNPFPLAKKDVVEFESPKSKAFLFWSAQTGKTITLIFFTDARFKSGSQVTDIQSGIEGSSISDQPEVDLTTTRAQIATSNSARGKLTLYNAGPDTAYIGGVAVTVPGGAAAGIPLAAGQAGTYKNTGDVYGVSAGTSTIYWQEEE